MVRVAGVVATLAFAATLSPALGSAVATRLPSQSPDQSAAASPAPPRVPLSADVSAGRLIKRVNPVYSKYARKNRIQGMVVMHAAISKEGDIVNLVVISGPPILTEAAATAVKQWKYRPYLVNGEPVEVETEVRVNFTLAGS